MRRMFVMFVEFSISRYLTWQNADFKNIQASGYPRRTTHSNNFHFSRWRIKKIPTLRRILRCWILWIQLMTLNLAQCILQWRPCWVRGSIGRNRRRNLWGYRRQTWTVWLPLSRIQFSWSWLRHGTSGLNRCESWLGKHVESWSLLVLRTLIWWWNSRWWRPWFVAAVRRCGMQ